jgi:hypothetical protein
MIGTMRAVCASLLVFLAGALAFAPAALAARPLLGVHGNLERFEAQTGQRSRVHHVLMGWGQLTGQRLDRFIEELGEIPMLGIKTGPVGAETITPREIAMGAGDDFLMDLNRAVAESGKRVYIRPMPEMNGHWNPYCAYTRDGRQKDAAHSAAVFRKAFARIYIILHGGERAKIDARLRRLGLPGVGSDLAVNPPDRLRVVWNPQGYGSPDLPGNSAQAYYPGDAFVDVVANDLYDIRGKAEWEANERLYEAHPSKPYAIGEWGLWGLDDPSFITRMAAFVRTHHRLELLSWFAGKPGSIFDLATKPRSREAYRELIAPLG